MSGRKWLVVLSFFLVISVGVGVYASTSLWGYAINPPSSAPLVDQITTIETVSEIHPDADYTITALPYGTLPFGLMDYPPARIVPLIEDRLPERLPEPDGDLLTSVGNVLANENVQLGQSAASVGPKPSGYLVRGSDASGEPLVYINLTSGSINYDDTYHYYEYLYTIDGNGQLANQLSSNTFAYDIAGIEFMSFWFVSLCMFTILALGFAFVWSVQRDLNRFITRRRSLQNAI